MKNFMKAFWMNNHDPTYFNSKVNAFNIKFPCSTIHFYKNSTLKAFWSNSIPEVKNETEFFYSRGCVGPKRDEHWRGEKLETTDVLGSHDSGGVSKLHQLEGALEQIEFWKLVAVKYGSMAALGSSDWNKSSSIVGIVSRSGAPWWCWIVAVRWRHLYGRLWNWKNLNGSTPNKMSVQEGQRLFLGPRIGSMSRMWPWNCPSGLGCGPCHDGRLFGW